MFDPYDVKAREERKPYIILLLGLCVLLFFFICWIGFHEITDILTDKKDFVKASNAVIEENYELVIDGIHIDMEKFDTYILREEFYDDFGDLYDVLEINHETDTVYLVRKER